MKCNAIMLRLKIYTSILFVLQFFVAYGSADKQCDPINLAGILECSETELCDTATRSCQCPPGLERKNNTYCVAKAIASQSTPNYSSLVDNQGSGSLVAGILIPLFLIIFVICGIYINRKYQISTWIRNKLNRRGESYDEFMIGQDLDDDDPPLRC